MLVHSHVHIYAYVHASIFISASVPTEIPKEVALCFHVCGYCMSHRPVVYLGSYTAGHYSLLKAQGTLPCWGSNPGLICGECMISPQSCLSPGPSLSPSSPLSPSPPLFPSSSVSLQVYPHLSLPIPAPGSHLLISPFSLSPFPSLSPHVCVYALSIIM